MQTNPHRLVKFLKDLRRRRVVQSAVAYVIGAWLIIEVSATVLPAFGVPDWTLRALIIFLVALFPFAMALSWYFDITREGIVETAPLDPEAEPEDIASEELEVDPVSFAERRSITVLRYSIDVRDGHGEDIDPEMLLELLPDLREQCGKLIRQHGGHLAWDNQGEAEVYFGYPLTLEQDATSAVRCALNIVRGIGADNPDDGVTIEVSAGICSGITVTEPTLEAKGGDSVQVTGKALRGAARLLDLAPPGKVVIAGSTRVLLDENFEFVPVDDESNAADSDRAWYVLREHAPIYNVTQQPPGAHLLGRDSEIRLIEDMWHRAKQEIGQSIAIVGEPGYGKSALVSHIIKKIYDEDGGVIAVCQCSYLNRDVALHPVADLYWRSLIGLDRVNSTEQRIEMIESFLRERNLDLERYVPILADLLRVGPTSKYPPLELEPQEIKDQTLEFIIDSLFLRASQQPVLLVFEDLHWADATTTELLGRIIRRGPESRLCTLLTFRPEFDAPWAGTGAVTQVTLHGLSKDQALGFVRELAAGVDLPEDLCNRIVDQSDGVPLFLEELTKAVLDSVEQDGVGTLENVPATLQETLMARLDRLGFAKRAAQMASAFGREFDYGWIAGLSEFSPEKLDEALGILVSQELLYQKGVPPSAHYFFKHVMIQEAAYESLLKRDRKQFHSRIAQLFEDEFRDWRQSHPQVVATHWAAADQHWKAANLYFEAGSHALRRSAYFEAEQQYRTALKQLDRLDSTRERKKLELEICVVLGQAMTPIRGFFSKAVESNYERARQLSVELGESETHFRINLGLWRAKIAQGRLLEAQHHAQETHDTARALDSEVSLIGSCTLLGITDFHLGNLAAAERRLEHVIKLYGSEPREGLAEQFGQDPLATALGWYAISRWLRGHPVEARGAMEQALEASRRIDHPFTHAYTLRQSLLLHFFCRELDRMLEIVKELEELSRANGFAEMALYVSFWRLALQACQRGPGENLDGIMKIVEQCENTGIVLNLPYIRGILAEQYLAAGRYEECAGELSAALDEANKLDIQWISAELYRLQGQLRIDQGVAPSEEAERFFKQAIDESLRQDNAFFGLRTRLDLARMYFDLDRREQAAAILAELDDVGVDPGYSSELTRKNRLEEQLRA